MVALLVLVWPMLAKHGPVPHLINLECNLVSTKYPGPSDDADDADLLVDAMFSRPRIEHRGENRGLGRPFSYQTNPTKTGSCAETEDSIDKLLAMLEMCALEGPEGTRSFFNGRHGWKGHKKRAKRPEMEGRDGHSPDGRDHFCTASY